MAGVAKSTVSRYLNGGYVSQETQQKIDEIIKKENYVPNNFAQSLKAKKNNLIGIVVPRLDSYATARSLAGIDDILRQMDYQLIISCTYQDVNREIEAIKNFQNQRVAGIILIIENLTTEHRDILQKWNVPCLLLGQVDKAFHCLIHDDETAGYEAGGCLIDHHHKKIMYVEEDNSRVSSWQRRKMGFKNKLNECQHLNIELYENKIDECNINKITAQILDEKITAVLCSTDKIAIKIIKNLHKNSINVPKDISVMGIGDYEIASMMTPELTTIHYPYKSFGEVAAKKMIELVEGKPIETTTIMPVEIKLRESVDNLKVLSYNLRD